MPNLSPAASYQINNASLFINGGADIIGTRGTATFNANREIRSITTEEGYPSAIQGYDRTIGWNATITCELTQLNSGSWPLIYEKGGTVSAAKLTPASANLLYSAGNYFSGVALTGTLGDNQTITVEFAVAMLDSYEWASDQQNEGSVNCTFTAVLSTTAAALDKNAAPYKIRFN